ncbi:polysaccharide lyase family 8 protein [Suillus paluster]|uniref:polysaccharide lyase family 8 protein n=1 Tax=Suillus paluster TaxID=48578 RepID=UPI001B87991A|nr:polysaccharide lyase family 8 protein [Suillus paluster]KAG1755247.1 polysaccharide lyase family 8 protein [Suillus paluster]
MPKSSHLPPLPSPLLFKMISHNIMIQTTDASDAIDTDDAITSASLVSPTTVNPTIMRDINTINQRRLVTIIEEITENPQSIASWIADLGADGRWPDSEVNYATGCDAQKADWPAQGHWQRISTMAAAWHGGLSGGEQYVNNSETLAAISLAMDYWFENDFTGPACLDSGGTPSCPCGTPGFWNKNYNCTHITLRAYGTFDHYINSIGYLTGSNTLDVAKIGIDQGLLVVNVSLITDTFRRVHEAIVVEQPIKSDGIRTDGSFSQHIGIIYNGNYGKDFSNDVLDLETEAGGTQFAANATSKTALEILFDGDRWMIFRNVQTNVLHWDFSVLGRFISFPVIDEQATSSINMNISKVQQLGEEWNSTVLLEFSSTLSANTTDANAGEIHGNRMFFDNDYMVTRGPGYVTTVRMYSNRTLNTECLNSQNPLGFHLSDGTVYTYLHGNEYEDIAAAWDWNLIPGTTVDYNATALDCTHTQYTGKEPFVGGVSDGRIGAAAMRYTNPQSGSLSWQKTWLFLETDVQHVMIANISSATAAPVFSVLDQRRFGGGVWVNGVGTYGGNYTDPQTMWHGDVGYEFPTANGTYGLSVEWGNRTGDWSSIGTSTQPPEIVELFTAWLYHNNNLSPVSYTFYPAVDYGTFTLKRAATQLHEIENSANISALLDKVYQTVTAVIWSPTGGSFTFQLDGGYAPITVTASANAAILYRVDSGTLTVSDPSQTLSELSVEMTAGDGVRPNGWGSQNTFIIYFTLPSGSSAGSSVACVLGQ